MAAKDEYFAAALRALRELAREELAFAEFEAVARLIEPYYDRPPFEPHHLTLAKNFMLNAGELATETSATRGGRSIPLLLNVDPSLGQLVDDAAARKRLVLGRYYGWTQGTAATGEGLTGAAGEIAAHQAIIRAGVGTSLATTFRERPTVAELLGVDVPTGPLDNALLLQPVTADLMPRPPYGVVAPIEVKNIREWIYPHTKELYQLLDKGVRLQRLLPDRPLTPVLICRKLHVTTTFMAKSLGFFVIDARRHYFPVHSRIESDRFAEMRRELALNDTTQDFRDTGRIEAGLRALQRKYDIETATATWKSLAFDDIFADLIKELRNSDGPARDTWVGALRRYTDELGYRQGW